MPDSERRSDFESPWWLSGEETCAYCCQKYHVEVEFRCIECDHPVCPLCVVTVRETREVLCPRCGSD